MAFGVFSEAMLGNLSPEDLIAAAKALPLSSFRELRGLYTQPAPLNTWEDAVQALQTMYADLLGLVAATEFAEFATAVATAHIKLEQANLAINRGLNYEDTALALREQPEAGPVVDYREAVLALQQLFAEQPTNFESLTAIASNSYMEKLENLLDGEV